MGTLFLSHAPAHAGAEDHAELCVLYVCPRVLGRPLMQTGLNKS